MSIRRITIELLSVILICLSGIHLWRRHISLSDGLYLVVLVFMLLGLIADSISARKRKAPPGGEC